MAKDPSFPFYASDWLGSTKRAVMTPGQRGAYIDLLCHQWGDATCSLEDDDQLLAALSGLNEGWFNGASVVLRKCFPSHPTLVGRIANPRLLELRAERDAWVAKSREGGRKSGVSRRKRQAKGGSTTALTKGQPKGNSPSPSPSSKKTPIVPTEFDAWWALWPRGRKVGKDAAERTYRKAVGRLQKKRGWTPTEAHQYLADRLRAFVASPKCLGDYCPHPSTWLNEGRYDDDPAAWDESGKHSDNTPTLPLQFDN